MRYASETERFEVSVRCIVWNGVRMVVTSQPDMTHEYLLPVDYCFYVKAKSKVVSRLYMMFSHMM